MQPDSPFSSNNHMDTEAERNAAADLIRQKVAAIYAQEPNAIEEIQEAEEAPQRSKHQEFMHQLNNSGKSLVEIQTAWHQYYSDLSNEEKHEVWQEFYAANQNATPYQQQLHQLDPTAAAVQAEPIAAVPEPVAPTPMSRAISVASIADIKKRVLDTVSAQGKLKAKHHLQSLIFGVASGLVVIFILLFGFFNEVFLAPFIQPSRTANETPVIVNTATAVVGSTPKVIIPKINVEIPVDYSQTTTNIDAIENALDQGIVHYPTTVRPGEVGNAAFFGHSSNNIFNPGKYKFAFVLLHELVLGDTFYLTNDGKAYAYRVIDRTVVDPSQVGVLGPYPGKTSTATLITCDPPGTSLKRLVVVGEQISPDPGANAEPASGAQVVTATEQSDLPGNGQTLWARMWGAIF